VKSIERCVAISNLTTRTRPWPAAAFLTCRLPSPSPPFLSSRRHFPFSEQVVKEACLPCWKPSRSRRRSFPPLSQAQRSIHEGGFFPRAHSLVGDHWRIALTFQCINGVQLVFFACLLVVFSSPIAPVASTLLPSRLTVGKLRKISDSLSSQMVPP